MRTAKTLTRLGRCFAAMVQTPISFFIFIFFFFFFFFLCIADVRYHMSHVMFMPNANNKDTDQPAHPRSLLSAFVARCRDNIIPLLAIAEISRP